MDDGTTPSAAVALPLLGLFLLMPPVITLFAKGAGFAGVPLIVVYVFGVWVALIACAAWLARCLDSERLDEPAGDSESRTPDPS